MQDSFQNSTTISALLAFTRRWLVLALIMGLAAAVLTFVVRQSLPASYTAEASLLLAAPQAGLESLGLVTPPMVDPGVYRSAILEGGILDSVLQQLGRPQGTAAERDLAKQISVSIDNQLISSIIRISVTARDAASAARIANLIADEVLQWDTDRGRQVLLTSVTALQASLAALDSQVAAAAAAGTAVDAALLARRDQVAADLVVAQERADSLTVGPLLKVLNRAALPFEPDPSRAGLLALLAFILVAGIALAAVWLTSLLRNGMEEAEAVEHATGLPVLAVFPPATQGSSRARRDAADILRSRLVADSAQASPVVIVVTSPTDAAEKGELAIALAESFGRAGQQTLLLDGNLRSPSTGDAFRLNEGEFVSLEQFLTDPSRRLEFVSVRLEGRPVFSLIPSFTPAGWPADLLRNSLGQLLKHWQRRFPVIIIDSAPLLPYPDTPAILSSADTVILATKLGLTTPEAARQAASTLLEMHGRLPRLVVSERDAALARFQRNSGQAADDYAISILRAPRKAPREGAEAALQAHNPVRR